MGVCLTVTKIEESAFGAEATGETLRRTTLGALRTGDGVNLETGAQTQRPARWSFGDRAY